MVYTKTIKQPAGGSVETPTQYRMPVTEGLIYKMQLYFPPGSSGLLHVRICDGGYQVWPSEPGETFFGDNHLIDFDDFYYVSSPDHNLLIYVYNLDTAFEHIFQLRIGQVSQEEYISAMLPSVAQDRLAETLAGLIKAQDQSYAAQRQRVLAKLGEEVE